MGRGEFITDNSLIKDQRGKNRNSGMRKREKNAKGRKGNCQ